MVLLFNDKSNARPAGPNYAAIRYKRKGGTTMLEIRHISKRDQSFWLTLDKDFCTHEFKRKVRDKRGYVISARGKPIGVMRYNLLWDNTPFLTLIYIEESYHGKGYGRQAMEFWEREMRTLGYQMVMTSTRVDEEAQHFYRKLGYIDRGGVFLDRTPLEQAQEMFMIKIL